MSEVANLGGSGQKVSTELNLVPFIDLLSTLVMFLLVTAVWMQISSIQASLDSKGNAARTDTPAKRLSIHLTHSGFQLDWPAGYSSRETAISKNNGAYNLEHLGTVLRAAAGKVSSVSVSADDNVEYGAVIQTIDTAKTNEFPAVALSTD